MRIRILLPSLFLAGTQATTCELDVDITCVIKENSLPNPDECIFPQKMGFCYEEATVTFTICASADDLSPATNVTLLDEVSSQSVETKKKKHYKGNKSASDKESSQSVEPKKKKHNKGNKSASDKENEKGGKQMKKDMSYIKVNGIETGIHVADFENAGKFVIGGGGDTASKSCVTYAQVINTCTSPIPTISAKLVGKGDGYNTPCDGRGDYTNTETTPQASLGLRVFDPTPNDAIDTIDDEAGFYLATCAVNPIALALGFAGVGLALAASTSPAGWLAIAAAIQATVSTFAGAVTCNDHQMPPRAVESIEDIIRRIQTFENWENSYDSTKRLFTQMKGYKNITTLPLSTLDAIDSKIFSVQNDLRRSKILSATIIGQVGLLAANLNLLRISKSPNPNECPSHIYFESLNWTINLILEAKKELEDAYEDRVTCRSGCSREKCANSEWNAWGECYSTGLEPQIQWRGEVCSSLCLNFGPYGCSRFTCRGGLESDQMSRAKRDTKAKWDTMVDEWWNGKGVSGSEGYVEGVNKYYEKLLEFKNAQPPCAIEEMCGNESRAGNAVAPGNGPCFPFLGSGEYCGSFIYGEDNTEACSGCRIGTYTKCATTGCMYYCN